MSHPSILAVALALCPTLATSQEELEHPDQFYTNGKKANAWTRNDDAALMSTFWFAKNPSGSLNYRQQIVIIYDNDPDKVYYYDVTTKRFIGRFDMRSEDYSMLPDQFRRERIEDVRESMFPPPGDMPSIGDMFSPPEDGNPNSEEMMVPPPTAKFPRLSESSWDTNYITADRNRIRARVEFDGNQGTYQLVGLNMEGELHEVNYARRGNGFAITGVWALGGSRGRFAFDIPEDNRDVFWGKWGFDPTVRDGTWDGIRVE